MKGAVKLCSEPGLSVFAVDVDALKADCVVDVTPIDPMVYQAEIDKLKEEHVAVAFLTVDRHSKPASGVWNLGLRRAGDLIDMGKVAAYLKDNSEHFVSGGGHAFAAGAQSNSPELSVVDLITDVRAACKASCHLNRLHDGAKEAQEKGPTTAALQEAPPKNVHDEAVCVCRCNMHKRAPNDERQTAIETDETKHAPLKAPSTSAIQSIPEEGTASVCWRPGQGKFRRQFRRVARFGRGG